jgi:putative membrane protein (TIGR04086 family)
MVIMMSAMDKVRSVKIGSPILSGLIYSFCSLFALILLASLILLWTQMAEGSLSFYVYIIHGIALVIGGFTSGKRAGAKGWYYGGTVGSIYGVGIILVGFLGFDAALMTLDSLILFVMSCVFASVGGMMGVNVKK